MEERQRQNATNSKRAEACACIRNAIELLSTGAGPLLSISGQGEEGGHSRRSQHRELQENSDRTDIDLRPIICMLIVQPSDENSAGNYADATNNIPVVANCPNQFSSILFTRGYAIVTRGSMYDNRYVR